MEASVKKDMCTVPDNVLEQLQKDVAEIKVALLGNQYSPEGLIFRMTAMEAEKNRIEKELNILKEKFNKMVWSISGAAAVIGGIASFLAQWFVGRLT